MDKITLTDTSSYYIHRYIIFPLLLFMVSSHIFVGIKKPILTEVFGDSFRIYSLIIAILIWIIIFLYIFKNSVVRSDGVNLIIGNVIIKSNEIKRMFIIPANPKVGIIMTTKGWWLTPLNKSGAIRLNKLTTNRD